MRKRIRLRCPTVQIRRRLRKRRDRRLARKLPVTVALSEGHCAKRLAAHRLWKGVDDQRLFLRKLATVLEPDGDGARIPALWGSASIVQNTNTTRAKCILHSNIVTQRLLLFASGVGVLLIERLESFELLVGHAVSRLLLLI